MFFPLMTCIGKETFSGIRFGVHHLPQQFSIGCGKGRCQLLLMQKSLFFKLCDKRSNCSKDATAADEAKKDFVAVADEDVGPGAFSIPDFLNDSAAV
jgi:hypothetical protein